MYVDDVLVDPHTEAGQDVHGIISLNCLNI